MAKYPGKCGHTLTLSGQGSELAPCLIIDNLFHTDVIGLTSVNEILETPLFTIPIASASINAVAAHQNLIFISSEMSF